MCILFVYIVKSYYDLSVLSMSLSVMFPKKNLHGR